MDHSAGLTGKTSLEKNVVSLVDDIVFAHMCMSSYKSKCERPSKVPTSRNN